MRDFSVELLLTLFHPKAALHDGGVIVRERTDRRGGLHFPGEPARNAGSEPRACGIAPGLESPRNRMRSQWLFRKRPAGFRFVIGAGSSAISRRKHSENASPRFYSKAIMKKLILNNWRAKLISLLLATTLWYLIKKNVATTPSPSEAEQARRPSNRRDTAERLAQETREIFFFPPPRPPVTRELAFAPIEFFGVDPSASARVRLHPARPNAAFRDKGRIAGTRAERRADPAAD